MRDYILKILKEEYEARIEDRDKAENTAVLLIKMQDVIDRHPKLAKKYDFKEIVDSFFKDYQNDDTILMSVIDHYSSSKMFDDNNNILFYAGSYNSEDEKWQYPRFSKKGNYDLYFNIETTEQIKNPIEEREDFEKDKKIIILDKPYPTALDFANARLDFFKSALREGQEEACQRVLKRKF